MTRSQSSIVLMDGLLRMKEEHIPCFGIREETDLYTFLGVGNRRKESY
jgi:hypothetical protein